MSTITRICVALIEAASVFESCLGLVQMIGKAVGWDHSGFILTGTFNNPGPYGGFVAVGIAVAVGQIALKHDWKSENLLDKGELLLSILTLILGILVLPASFSRAGWLALAVSLIVLGFWEFHWRDFIKRHRLVTVLAVSMVLLACIGAFALKPKSALGRLHIWRIECRAIAEKPWLGHGHGSVLGVYGETQEKFFREKEHNAIVTEVAGCPEYAFNEYLKIGVEHGLPLMLAVVAVIALAVSSLLITKRSSLAYGMIALCVFSFFSYPLSLPQFRVILMLFFIASLPNVGFMRWLQGCAVLSLLGASVFYVYPKEKQSRVMLEECRLLGIDVISNHDEQAVERLSDLYSVLKKNYRYLYDYGYSLMQVGKYNDALKILSEGAAISSDPMFRNMIGKCYQALGDLIAAEKEYNRAHFMVPSRLYPHVLLMEMYVLNGKNEEAMNIGHRIISTPVNVDNQNMMDLLLRAQSCLDTLEIQIAK